MNDAFENKLKEFLPYIIIIGIVYLVMPAIMVFTNTSGVFNQIVYMGVFPLTAFVCALHYGYKKTNDFFLSLVAPVIYIPSMLLYGNLRDSVINSIIFLVSYFICGYLGLTVGEMIQSKGKANDDNDAEADTRKRVPSRVKTVAHEHKTESDYLPDEIELPQKFNEFETYDTTSNEPASTDATEDDIDAILAELHNRQI